MPDTDYSVATVAAPDGYELHYRHYPAKGKLKAVVAGFHGIQSHAGWYEASCCWLAERGYEVYFFDRRGSGLNMLIRGHASGPEQLIEDFRHCLSHVRSLHPGLPLIVMAISWGGKLACFALSGRSDLADGLMLIGPGLVAKVRPSLREQWTILWSSLLRPYRMVPIPLADPALFTDNPDRQKFIADDILSLRQGSTRLLITSRRLDLRLKGAAKKVTVPTLLILAEKDRIIDNNKTQRIVELFAADDKTIIVEPGSHTLEFEPDPTHFFKTMTDWLELRFGKK